MPYSVTNTFAQSKSPWLKSYHLTNTPIKISFLPYTCCNILQTRKIVDVIVSRQTFSYWNFKPILKKECEFCAYT